MNQHFIQIAAAILLGATVGLDKRLEGKKFVVVNHILAALTGVGFVACNGSLDGVDLILPTPVLGLIASLSAVGVWLREKRSRRDQTGATHTSSSGEFLSLANALAFGLACGLSAWTLVGGVWLEMFAFYVGRLSLGTETTRTGLPMTDYVHAGRWRPRPAYPLTIENP